jgi:squalene cyclase
VLEKAHAWIDANQIREDVPDARRYFRDRVKGTWPFSTAEQGWSVSDCTAEALKVALQFAPLTARPMPVARLRDTVDALLESQNRDGGWSEYEKARASRVVELLNAAEVFGDIMIGYSYVECTSACVQALLAFREAHPGYREREIEQAVRARGSRGRAGSSSSASGTTARGPRAAARAPRSAGWSTPSRCRSRPPGPSSA